MIIIESNDYYQSEINQKYRIISWIINFHEVVTFVRVMLKPVRVFLFGTQSSGIVDGRVVVYILVFFGLYNCPVVTDVH
ncbi:hypothetical protein SNEBB_010271 [Seison nebaliae]|nr:hypothetical protein SNEBB_010271 [Seison nebaliae]